MFISTLSVSSSLACLLRQPCKMVFNTTRCIRCEIIRYAQILTDKCFRVNNYRQYFKKIDEIEYYDIVKVLRVLNESSAASLERFHISKLRSEKIVECRTVNGMFETLNDVLLVEGVGAKSLSQICYSILTEKNKKVETNIGKEDKKNESKQRSWVTPGLFESQRENCNTVVGLHITNYVVSWAKFSKDRHLLNWDILNLPENLKKPHPSILFDLALAINQKLPKADLYVMEDLFRSSQPASNKMSALFSNVQLWQLRAILLTLLNTYENNFEKEDATPTLAQINKVHFLRPHLAARLFSVLVGSESVSLENIVEDVIVSKCRDASVPYGQIVVGKLLHKKYSNMNGIDRENMGQALLLTMTFLDLIVHRNPASLKFVAG